MPYVMVPVPEEHATEAMRAVVRMVARTSIVEWDDESVAALWDASDEPTRLVLAAVARAVSGGGAIAVEQLAVETGLTAREVLGVVQEVDEAAAAASRPAVLVHRASAAPVPERDTARHGVVSMPRAVAEAVGAGPPADHPAPR